MCCGSLTSIVRNNNCCVNLAYASSCAAVITFLVIGILAMTEVGLFASFAHPTAIGISSLVLAGSITILFAIYMVTKSSKKSVIESSSLSIAHAEKDELNAKGMVITLLKLTNWEDLDIQIREGKDLTVQEYEKTLKDALEIEHPTLLLLEEEDAHCALNIPVQIKGSDEKSMLILLVYKKRMGRGPITTYKVIIQSPHGTKKLTTEYQSHIVKKYQYNSHQFDDQEALMLLINNLLTSSDEQTYKNLSFKKFAI